MIVILYWFILCDHSLCRPSGELIICKFIHKIATEFACVGTCCAVLCFWPFKLHHISQGIPLGIAMHIFVLSPVSKILEFGMSPLWPILGITNLVPYLIVKSLQLFWRASTHRFHLWVWWSSNELQWLDRLPGGCLNIKMLSHQYRDPHVKDRTVSWPSYL